MTLARLVSLSALAGISDAEALANKLSFDVPFSCGQCPQLRNVSFDAFVIIQAQHISVICLNA